jgi:hypothetical protein
MPPDQYGFQKATQGFQSTRLFSAAEPLLDAIDHALQQSIYL